MIRQKSNIVLHVILVVITITSFSCSTKKNTFIRRAFHNLTGHYNMFWNGRESYREGVVMLEESVQDNYNKILPVFNYGTEAEAQSMNPYMDKAIEKASINIQRHSMYFSRKEWVKKIDDSYLLIGLSYFYKQEYNKSRRTFEFVINEYKENDIRFEAMLWLANSHIQLKKYKRARSVIDNLQNEINKDPTISKKVQKMLPLVRADLYIHQEKYTQAIEPLNDALYLHQKKSVDTRARFVLGQIYQEQGEYSWATDYYTQVIKKNPPYEMAFNAAINLAKCYDIRYEDDSKKLVKKLSKMLKEDKNKDFLDQIYYALSDIAFKESKDSLAIEYLRLSVATSKSNQYQKVTSALKLGDIYFDIPEYQLSQAYYDTAVQVMPEDYPDYEKIKARTTYLTELVTNLIIVETEDSLQRLVSMTDEERFVIIDKIIEDVIAEEERQKELEELALLTGGSKSPGGVNTIGSPTGSGSWYFYNPQAINFGLNEFKKKWGNRVNEDNWRLSNKQVLFEQSEEDIIALGDSLTSDSMIVASNDPHSREYYLQNLPFTEEQLIFSDSLIQEALYNLGFIYKDKLDDYPMSIQSFETLIESYPENKNLLQVYYQLYRIYTNREDFEKAEEYKALIISQFPESDYAKLLLDPNYYKELEAQKNLARILYIQTYEHYQDERYYTVYSNCTRALNEFEGPPDILAKFEYLRALALGKIEVVDSLQVALEGLIAKYPDSEVIPMAQNLLDYIAGPIDTIGGKVPEEELIDISMYEFNPDSKQIFALLVNGNNVNVNALKVRISDFNLKYYNLENLSITNILLDAKTHFIMVGNFNSINKAMQYYNGIVASEYVFGGIPEEESNSFVIAQENYPIFYKDKDITRYLAFFKQNYLTDQ